MNVSKPAFIASVFALFFGFCMPAYAQTKFTVAEFLEWEKPAQDSFFQISITMAGVVTTQTHTTMAGCIDEWYFQSDETMSERNQAMLATMEKYPDNHPSGIVAAFIEKECGLLTDRN